MYMYIYICIYIHIYTYMYPAEQVPHKGLLLAKSIEVQTGKEADVRSTLLCVYFCSFVRVCALVCAGDALYACVWFLCWLPV